MTVSGTPQFVLTIGSTSRQADYVPGAVYKCTSVQVYVQSGDLDTDGVVVSSLSANGGTLRDSANNDMSLALNSVGNTTAVLVDASVPSVTSVSVPSNWLFTGDNLILRLMRLKMYVSGTPQLVLTIGSNPVRQTMSPSGTSALVFRYTVQSGDLDTDGVVVSSLSPMEGHYIFSE